MTWAVVDASVIVHVVAGGALAGQAAEKWGTWYELAGRVAAPALVWFEVTNALWTYRRMEQLSPQESVRALDAALGLGVEVVAPPGLHHAALDAAARYGLAASYDPYYLALAVHLDAPLWTADARLARAVTDGRVELIG